MGYDAKAVLVPKSIKTMANGDKFFFKTYENGYRSRSSGKKS